MLVLVRHAAVGRDQRRAVDDPVPVAQRQAARRQPHPVPGRHAARERHRLRGLCHCRRQFGRHVGDRAGGELQRRVFRHQQQPRAVRHGFGHLAVEPGGPAGEAVAARDPPLQHPDPHSGHGNAASRSGLSQNDSRLGTLRPVSTCVQAIVQARSG